MEATELSARKRAVLSAVVKAYIDTGEPVGSKILTGLIENAPSSATLRNEMNELCSLGLLTQPHTSAGRVPTSEGYRIYINDLMKPQLLQEDLKNYIDSSFCFEECDPYNTLKNAADVIFRLTGFPSVAYYCVADGTYLKSAELLRVSNHSAVLVLISSDGRTNSRVCRIKSGCSEKLFSDFRNVFDTSLKRKPLSSFDRANLQGIVASLGLSAFDLLPILSALFETAGKMSESLIYIGGYSELYRIFGERRAHMIRSYISESRIFASMINSFKNNTIVLFGEDIRIPELSGTTVVVSKIHSQNIYCGGIGIIGTGRMSYDQIIPSIEYSAKVLSHELTKSADEMEEQ